jgi:hypothetical protein
VTDGAGNPLSFCQVNVWDDGGFVESRFTDPDGAYTADLLDAGSYRLQVVGRTGQCAFADEWYLDEAGPAGADPVTVALGATTTGIDFAMGDGSTGAIRGHVTDTAGAPLDGCRVEAVSAATGFVQGSARTWLFAYPDGSYVITPVDPGTYKVRFRACTTFTPAETFHGGEFHQDQADAASADPVVVVAGGTTTGIDGTLARAVPGAISGRVTDGAGNPVGFCQVNVWDDFGFVESRFTSITGAYTADLLDAGSYRVQVVAGTGGCSLGEWYEDEDDFSMSDPVTVLLGATTSGIDVRLGPSDTDPPETTIDTAPSGPSNRSTAAFAFSSDEDGSTFECRLDEGDFAACSTPTEYTGLLDGVHTFEVRAVDAARNADPSPAGHIWSVDTTPPQAPAITDGPGQPSTTATAATFGFTGAEPDLTFRCSLDGGAAVPCVSPVEHPGPLTLGPHSFGVRAVDTAGNEGPAATYAWSVHGPGGILRYAGTQLALAGTTAVVPGVTLTGTVAECLSGRVVTFGLDRDPDGAGPATAGSLGSATLTDGTASGAPVDAAGWTPGVYTITTSLAATSLCDAPTADETTLVVAQAGDAASGGGWYTNNGRMSFGFTIRRTTAASPGYRGEITVINKGKWRLKGSLDQYGTLSASEGVVGGRGDLYRWVDPDGSGLLEGSWQLAASGVSFTARFTDSGQGGRRSSDRFGITVDHPFPRTNSPNSAPVVLKGGDVRVG